ncbi:MAG: hypothetical protein J6Y40_01525 [Bacteroidales bacterium]|nr:hypothetical protein [Bacteroidales bacterium]
MNGNLKEYVVMGRYNKIALYAVTVFLLVTSFFIKFSPASFFSLERTWTMPLGIVFCIVLLITVYIVCQPVIPSYKDRLTAVVMSAALLFACPGSLSASFIHIAAIALLWAQFCLFSEQYFTAFFLMAISSMFFPPVVWIALLVIIIMLASGLTDTVRNLLKFIGGFIVPYILLFSAAFIIGYDIESAIRDIFSAMTTVYYDFFSLNIPMMFLVACLIFMLVHAIILFSGKMREYGIAEAYALKIQIINVVVCVAEVILFASTSEHPVALLACCPSGILLARYFSQYGARSFLRVEIVVLLCALVISRLGNFIV